MRFAHLVRLEQARGRCSLSPYSEYVQDCMISEGSGRTPRSRRKLTSEGATAADLAPEREQAEPMSDRCGLLPHTHVPAGAVQAL